MSAAVPISGTFFIKACPPPDSENIRKIGIQHQPGPIFHDNLTNLTIHFI
ncbi:hypothetical protein GYO_3858 [Bacillus spizizenii TU-B-10]|uniref:Uncharacterized protein n=1 Tax=Bacillus spizizenii (strain DSM 15029 / JCM 12233 / NBRC 101239 / NRRL B-23049 / TU-B-10) TaxID=1052585 RepID=G4P1A0_BACS4|nr:hypothetical protein GYO_3858 [Bacillus spizizenii TU-B-10]